MRDCNVSVRIVFGCNTSGRDGWMEMCVCLRERRAEVAADGRDLPQEVVDGLIRGAAVQADRQNLVERQESVCVRQHGASAGLAPRTNELVAHAQKVLW